MAGKIGENLLSAISTVVTSEIQKLKFDKTVEAVIQEVTNAATGEYKVKFEGNIVKAYANDTSEVYKVNDTVLMKIPEGDMSNKKTIEGKIAFSNDYTSYTDLSNYIIDVGPGFNKFYNNFPSDSYGLIAGVAPLSKTFTLNSNGNELFQRFSKDNNKIKVSAEFATNLFGNTTQGNYGLKITFVARDYDATGQETTKDISYTMDITDFSGSPYRYSVFNPQSVVLDVQKDHLLGLKKIEFFQEDFEPDTWQTVEYNSSGDPQIVTKTETEKANLFVRNINIQFVNSLDLTKSIYYLHIATPEGVEVSNSKDSVILQGRLFHLGADVTDSSDVIYRWYKRNLTIFKGDEKYDQYAGEGWEVLTTGSNTLTVHKADVPYKNEYKLIAINNNENLSAATIEVFNSNSSYALSIEQITSNTSVSLSIKNSLSSKQYVGSWYYSTGSGSLVQLTSEDQMVNTIDITPYVNYANIIFYCHVVDNGTFIVELTKTLENLTAQEDFTVIFSGRSMYHYDANGDIDVEDSEIEKTLSANITLRDGYITSYQALWIMGDGETSAPASPDSISFGMLKDVYYDSNNVLHYFILPKFNFNKAQNNTITLRIITVDNQVYNFPYELSFLKDGDQGTNGTTFNVVVRRTNNSGDRLLGFQPLFYRNDTWISNTAGNEYYITAFVYKDGEEISQNDNYSISYKWTSLGGINVNNAITQTCRVLGTDIDADYFVAKVQVSITDQTGSDNGKSTIVYYNFPLDVVKNLDINKFSDVDLPNSIMYSASGVNATYNRDKISIKYNGKDVSSQLISGNESIFKVYNTEEGTFLRPAVQFLGNNFTYLSYTLGNGFLHHTVLTYLNTYGNEAINSWDGTSIELDTKGNCIYAPQIGAGKKNNDNTFSGVVMGQDPVETSVGLYGYNQGVNTFGLKDDGTAYFGAADSGRITIDGNQAVIRGGNSLSGTHSMTLQLADTKDGISDPNINAIAIRGDSSTPAFSVNYNGNLKATSANIKGDIYADYIEADRGRIGDWKITRGNLQSSNGQVVLGGTDGTIIGAHLQGGSINIGDGQFVIDKYGTSTLRNGQIGGWIFDMSGASQHGHGYLQSDDNQIDTGSLIIYPDGTLIGGAQSAKGGWSIEDSQAEFYDVTATHIVQGWRLYSTGRIYAYESNINNPSDNNLVVTWGDLDDYATKEYVDDAIDEAIVPLQQTISTQQATIDSQAATIATIPAKEAAARAEGYREGYADGEST